MTELNETASDADRRSNRDAQIEVHEMSMARSDEQANDLIDSQIGPWTVIGVQRNKRNRNVYVVRHRDGFMKGLRGYQLNAMLAAARRDGVAVL